MSSTNLLQNLFTQSSEEYHIEYKKLSIDCIRQPGSLYYSEIDCDHNDNAVILPIVVWKNENTYSIVDGCKRFAHMVSKGIRECICGIINLPFDSLKSAALRIQLNKTRNLHLREKVQFVSWMKENCESECYRQSVMELGISDKERFELEKLTTCSDTVINAVCKGIIDLQTASVLDMMNETDLAVCLDLFAKIPFSRQQQRELLEWLPEIAFSSGETVCSVLNDNEINDILRNEKINIPQKAQKIRDCFFQKRFPTIVKVKECWTEHINKINPDPSKVHFSTSEAFEKNRLELKITLIDGQKAVSILKKLSEISKEDWEKLIYPGSV